MQPKFLFCFFLVGVEIFHFFVTLNKEIIKSIIMFHKWKYKKTLLVLDWVHQMLLLLAYLKKNTLCILLANSSRFINIYLVLLFANNLFSFQNHNYFSTFVKSFIIFFKSHFSSLPAIKKPFLSEELNAFQNQIKISLYSIEITFITNHDKQNK